MQMFLNEFESFVSRIFKRNIYVNFIFKKIGLNSSRVAYKLSHYYLQRHNFIIPEKKQNADRQRGK